MQLKNAPFGRLVAGVSALNTLMTTIPPPIFLAQPTAALSISDTLILAAIVWQPQPDYFTMS